MPAYETEAFQPPAPVVHARIVGPAGARSDVRLLVDSGADVSVVPRDAAVAVGARIARSAAPIQLLSGQELVLDQAELAVEFLRYRFRGAFVVIDSDHGVVGRNILNALRLTLDGPRLEWSVVD